MFKICYALSQINGDDDNDDDEAMRRFIKAVLEIFFDFRLGWTLFKVSEPVSRLAPSQSWLRPFNMLLFLPLKSDSWIYGKQFELQDNERAKTKIKLKENLLL